MTKTIIVENLKSFGNGNVARPISTSVTGDINKIKTIQNGSWVSWNKDVEEEFLGFTTFERGQGYLASGNGSIELDAEEISIWGIPVLENNWSYVKIPTGSSKTLPAGNTDRFEAKIVKTYDGSWVSWNLGTEDDFQGITEYNNELGYIVYATKVFNKAVFDDKSDFYTLDGKNINDIFGIVNAETDTQNVDAFIYTGAKSVIRELVTEKA